MVCFCLVFQWFCTNGCGALRGAWGSEVWVWVASGHRNGLFCAMGVAEKFSKNFCPYLFLERSWGHGNEVSRAARIGWMLAVARWRGLVLSPGASEPFDGQIFHASGQCWLLKG